MKKQLAAVALLALAAFPMAAQAIVYQFNATLNTASEIPAPTGSSASGLATLFYDTADNTFDFSMGVFGLTGGPTAGTAAGGHHIHGLATTTQTAGVQVALNGGSFTRLNQGSTLLVGGINTPSPGTIPAANGHAARSFLQALQDGLMYVNVHTALNPAGEVRGQLFPVAVVPEPGTTALMLGGLAAVGGIVRRRQRA